MMKFFGSFSKKIFGSVNERNIKSFAPLVNKINFLEKEISCLNDESLKAKTLEFKKRLKNNETLNNILPEAFAVVRETSKRVLNMRHFDVQLIGGMVLNQGKISEMKTGEGKTLVSTLACYLNALEGKGVHIVTVNDYLAKRDSNWMGDIYKFLNLSVGCITSESNNQERKIAYNCDITYATNNELGFDYLRDNMKFSLEDMVQRGRNFAIIDEVDSILIDEARTPLIISGPTNNNNYLYNKINELIPQLNEDDFLMEEKEKSVFLTDNGINNLEKLLRNNKLIKEDRNLYDLENISITHHINQSLRAHKLFKNEVDYLIKDGNVVIIDEFTGRMQEGRRFSDGLHQALEAKEKLAIKEENQTLASITFQNYFRLYNKLSGMTGTAATEAVEFEEIYKLKVIEIPTNKPVTRDDENDQIYKSKTEKYNAIINTIKECYKKNQPVLIGTINIEQSEYLSKFLKKNKLPHNILNAKHHEKEAGIIENAGVAKTITIATNMAGRGTDIVLGGNSLENKETVIKSGGLYVIGTERHESRRIDNQLRGRSGRQGDPGKSKFFISLEDDLMRIFGSEKLKFMLSKLGLKDDQAITHPWITKALAKAQQKVELRNYDIRKNLIKYDDIINNQRKVIFDKRLDIIKNDNISNEIKEIYKDINDHIVENNIIKNSFKDLNTEIISKELNKIYSIKDINIDDIYQKCSKAELVEIINKKIEETLEDKKNEYGEEILKKIYKQIYLITLDEEWKNHLLTLDKLRQGINFRAYAQKDPLLEYKRDAFNFFEEMMNRMEEKIISRIFHLKLKLGEELQDNILPKAQKFHEHRKDLTNKNNTSSTIVNNFSKNNRDPSNPSTWGNIGRNEKCPCGSEKKYKHCHGKIN